MMKNENKPLPLPPMFFVASISASLFLAAGLIGIFAPQVSSLLADRPIAFACIGAGAVLELWAMVQLFGIARQNQSRKQMAGD
jgi:hypothetical protein